LEEFFHEAASATYAVSPLKSTILELPMSKVYRYRRGDLLYVDMYWTNGEYSGGKTLIYADDIPVWMMDYDGWCKGDGKRITAFLKQALCAQYTTGKFYGGRGPDEFYETEKDREGLVYRNHPYVYHTGFAYFQGRERIFEWPAHTTDLFWHRYKGLLLFGDVSKNTAIYCPED
jgi:hypothetical protein